MSNEVGADEIREFEQAESRAKTWLSLWQDLADYIMPRKSAITERKTHEVEGWTDSVFNNDAVHANNVAAAGAYDYLFSGRFFDCEPPIELQKYPRAKRWYRQSAEVMIEDLASSNFQTEIHEALLNRGGFGTCHVHLEEGKRNFYSFSTADVGDFFVEEDNEGYVSRIWIRYAEKSACWMVEEFGEENCPEEVIKDYRNSEKKYNPVHEVIHSVKPRMEQNRNPNSLQPKDKAIASIWTHKKSKKIVRNSGYDEMPDFVSRYLKWGKAPYGFCPGIEILPVAKQLNFIEMIMDAQAEIKVFPRMLWPHNMPGNINLYAGGVTIIDPNNVMKNDLPREWMTAGDLRDMDARLERKQRAIERAYHVDMFRMLAQRDKQMTATEVAERVAEKLINFSPTYGRITTELVGPIIQRMFSMGLRAPNKFPTPPPEVIKNGPAGPYIPLPKVTYISKIALALRALQNRNFVEYMQIMGPIFEVNPSAAIAVNWDHAAKKVAENVGLPVDFIHTEDVIKQLRGEAAQQQQIVEGSQVAANAAKAAKDASEVNPEKLQNMIQQ